MYSGVLALDKPQGFTSHDAVAKLRGILGQKRIGHAGTLDPMATGVLVVLLGAATKASEDASGMDKAYVAGLRPGLVTDTYDIWGTPVSKSPQKASAEALRAVLPSFTGDILQVPPMYSAVQIDGKRLYSLARKGIEVEREARRIHISRISILEPDSSDIPPGAEDGDLYFSVTCSKGTYIRALCHDIGRVLGCGGCMCHLRRVSSGGFGIGDAIGFGDVEALHGASHLASALLPTDGLYRGLPAVYLNHQGWARAKHGNFVDARHIRGGLIPLAGGRCRVYDAEGSFCMTGIGKPQGDGIVIACDKMFV